MKITEILKVASVSSFFKGCVYHLKKKCLIELFVTIIQSIILAWCLSSSQHAITKFVNFKIVSPVFLSSFDGQCLTVDDIMRTFGFEPETASLSKTDFSRLCPSLVQQAVQGCPNAVPEENPKPSDAEGKSVYGRCINVHMRANIHT